MRRTIASKGLALGALAALAALAVANIAEAATMPLVNTSFVVDSTGAVAVDPLTIAGPGTLTVKLSDIPWPQELASAGFELVTSTGQVIGKMTGFGSETFNILSAGTLYALSCGTAQPPTSNNLGFGSYGLAIDWQPQTPTAVPLPGGRLLFGSGLAGLLALLALSRRRLAGPQHSTLSERACGALVA